MAYVTLYRVDMIKKCIENDKVEYALEIYDTLQTQLADPRVTKYFDAHDGMLECLGVSSVQNALGHYADHH